MNRRSARLAGRGTKVTTHHGVDVFVAPNGVFAAQVGDVNIEATSLAALKTKMGKAKQIERAKHNIPVVAIGHVEGRSGDSLGNAAVVGVFRGLHGVTGRTRVEVKGESGNEEMWEFRTGFLIPLKSKGIEVVREAYVAKRAAEKAVDEARTAYASAARQYGVPVPKYIQTGVESAELHARKLAAALEKQS